MADKVIGILGGMGPEATLELFHRIILNTPAEGDRDHLHVVIVSNPKVPDRTAAILAGGESPVPAMAAGIKALARAGADFVVIPCVSAHYFIEELRRESALPILSMFDVTVGYIRRQRLMMNMVGLLGTTGTIRGGRFSEHLAASGIYTLTPAPADQERIMAAIYAIKAGARGEERARIRKEVTEIALKLVMQGAHGIIAGCTEIPLVLACEDLPVPLLDTLQILARSAIATAGRTPAAPPQGLDPP
jgi:aspartate racemase